MKKRISSSRGAIVEEALTIMCVLFLALAAITELGGGVVIAMDDVTYAAGGSVSTAGHDITLGTEPGM